MTERRPCMKLTSRANVVVTLVTSRRAAAVGGKAAARISASSQVVLVGGQGVRERTRSAPPTRVELTERPSIRLTPADEPRRPRSPQRRSHDICGDTVPSFTITPTGDGGSTTSWAGSRRWSRGTQLRPAIGANQPAPAPKTPERRRPSRAPRPPSDSRSRSPHDRQAATQQPGSSSSAAWGSTYGGYTEEEWAQWRSDQWWGHRGWWNWWNW